MHTTRFDKAGGLETGFEKMLFLGYIVVKFRQKMTTVVSNLKINALRAS